MDLETPGGEGNKAPLDNLGIFLKPLISARKEKTYVKSIPFDLCFFISQASAWAQEERLMSLIGTANILYETSKRYHAFGQKWKYLEEKCLWGLSENR